MKKVLFATTALVASAGFAAADITFSGSAEMGIVGGGKNAPGVSAYEGNGNDSTTEFNNDFTLTVVGSGQTDSGLSFGISIDFSKSNDPDAGNGSDDAGVEFDNEAVFISGDFGTLTLGEIDGAVDRRLIEVYNATGQYSIGDEETVHAGFQGSYGDGAYDNQILRYDYTFGDFGFSASMELDDTDAVDNGYALALSYNTDMGGVGLGFGLGYQYLETSGTGWAPGNLEDYTGLAWIAGTEVDIIAATVSADFNNGFTAGLEYSNFDPDGPSGTNYGDIDHYSIGLGYSINALSLGVSYGKYDADIGDADGYALTAAYDLGGGATIVAAYSDSDVDGVASNADDFDTYSLGIVMNF